MSTLREGTRAKSVRLQDDSMQAPKPGTGNQSRVPGSEMSDDQIYAVGIRLYRESGRVPRVADIASAAGGVRKSRAVAARQRVARFAADDAASRWINVSPEFEQTVRELLGTFLTVARQESAHQIGTYLSDADDRLQDAQNIAARLSSDIDALRSDLDAATQRILELSSERDQLQTRYERARRDAKTYRMQAKERKAALDLLASSKA